MSKIDCRIQQAIPHDVGIGLQSSDPYSIPSPRIPLELHWDILEPHANLKNHHEKQKMNSTC